MGRTVGRGLKEFRKAASDLRQEFEAEGITEELKSGLEEEPRASVEQRAARLAEKQKADSAEASRGEAPPT
jgi:Sec-independent protein translocase protein TatA